MKQEHDKRQASLIAEHNEQLKRTQLQAENELREEDRQRALLQLQWKVMSDKPKEDQEVNSKQVDLCFNLFVCVCLQMDAIFANFHVGIPLSIKGGGHPHPSKGSLNPYAEDPYAFD
ncbi:hypothetical protein JHK87_007142 [Glycine soja]|nr:hypothetical protein JHK87_007142 [Glycine soja]